MTEFDRWRIARQEAEHLLQQCRQSQQEGRAGGGQAAAPRRDLLGLAHHAAAVRAAALRLLRPGAR